MILSVQGQPGATATAASGVSLQWAVLNGALTDGNSAFARIYWGPTDGGASTSSWAHVIDLGLRHTGTLAGTASGLVPGRQYFYRTYAANGAGQTAWAASSVRFTAATWAAWNRKMRIRFPGYTRSERLSGFPVLVRINPATDGIPFDQLLAPDARDLRFSDETGTRELPYEIEKWDPAGDSFVWVQIPALAADSHVWAYMGNAGADAPPYTTNGAPWSAGYQAVWHMNDGGVGDRRDSTAHGFDAAPQRYSGDETTPLGIAAGADTLDGVSNYLAIRGMHYAVDGEVDQITVSAWVKSSSANQQILVAFDRGEAWRLALKDDMAPNRVGWNTKSGPSGTVHDAASPAACTDGRWHYLCGWFRAGTGIDKQLFVDGQPVSATNAHGGKRLVGLSAGVRARFGFIGVGSRADVFNGTTGPNLFLNGTVDEVRIESVARSSNWIWACWQNVVSNAQFRAYDSAVGVRPPAVFNRAASAITSRSADLNAELISTGLTATAVSVYWGTTDGGTNPAAWSRRVDFGPNQRPGALQTTLTSLTAATTYCFRFSAINADGRAWAPETATFETVGPPAVTNVEPQGLSFGRAVLCGDLIQGAFAHRSVYFGRRDGGTAPAAWDGRADAGYGPEGVFTATATGLPHNVLYAYRAFASNESGTAWAPVSGVFTSAWDEFHWDGQAAADTWSQRQNWDPDRVPSGAMARVHLDHRFLASLPATIQVDGQFSLGALAFAGTNNVSLDGLGSLQLADYIEKGGSGIFRLDSIQTVGRIHVLAGSLRVGNAAADSLTAGDLTCDSAAAESVRFENGFIAVTNAVTLNRGRLFVNGAGTVLTRLEDGSLFGSLVLNGATWTQWDVAQAAGVRNLDAAVLVNGGLGALERRIAIGQGAGTGGTSVHLRNVTLSDGAVLSVDEINSAVRLSLRLAGSATLTDRAGANSDDVDLVNVTSPGAVQFLRLGETNSADVESLSVNLYGRVGTNAVLDLINGPLYLQAGAAIAAGGRIRSVTNDPDNVIYVHAGKNMASFVAGGGVIEMAASRPIHLYVNRATPLLVNSLNVSIDVPAGQTAQLHSNWDTGTGQNGYANYSNVVLRTGSTLYLVENNAARVVANPLLRGSAAIVNDDNGNDVFIRRIADDRGLRTLTVRGTQNTRLIGSLSGTVTVDVRMSGPAVAAILTGTSEITGAFERFDLGGRRLNLNSGELHVWTDCGAGTLNHYSASPVRVYQGKAGAVSMNSATVINVLDGRTVIGYVNRATPGLTNDVRATISVASAASATLQSNWDAGAGANGWVRWRNVRLNEAATLNLAWANAAQNRVDLLLAGSATVKNNSGSDLAMFLGSVTDTGVGHTLRVAGANRLRMLGVADAGVTLAIGGDTPGAVELEDGWRVDGRMILDADGLAQVDANGRAAAVEMRGGAIAFPAGQTLTVSSRLQGDGALTGAAGQLVLTDGATLSPGVNAGVLTVAGSLALNPNTRLDFELGGPVSDEVAVGGNLVLDGVIDVRDLGGLTNTSYTVISYAGTLTDNGLRVGELPAGFAASIDTSVRGLVRVRVAKAAGPVVVATGARSVGRAQASFEGALLNGGAAHVVLHWGNADGGTNAAAWAHVADLDWRPAGALSLTLKGLSGGTRYVYRWKAENAMGADWSDPATFTTASIVEYPNRVKITFRGYDRGEILTNFPALVVLSTNSIPGFRYDRFVSQAGDDLRFLSADRKSLLYHDVEEWNRNGSSYVWVRVPELAPTGTVIWAAWGNPLDTNRQGYVSDGSVWSDGHVGVWHLDQVNGVEDLRDSTRFANHVTVDADTANADGIVSKGQLFDGGTDYMSVPDSDSLSLTGDMTLSAWVRVPQFPTNTTMTQNIVAKDGNNAYRFRIQNTGSRLWMLLNDGAGTPPYEMDSVAYSFATSVWYNVATRVDLLAREVRFFVNGVQVGNPQPLTDTADVQDTTGPLILGNYAAAHATEDFIGVMDEVRISDRVRSANWLWASWLNVASNAAFALYEAPPEQKLWIESQPPANVTLLAATLNGYLGGAGTGPASVSVYWGPQDGGQDPASWAYRTPMGVRNPGSLSTNVPLPLANSCYYYRFHVVSGADADWANRTEFFVAAPVGVRASDDLASEADPIGDRGEFTVYRPASAASEPLTLAYSLAGSTASLNGDYSILPAGGLVTIPAGATNATLVVTANADRTVEGNEFVRITLPRGALYVVGPASNATVTIVDSLATNAVDLVWDNAQVNSRWDTTTANWHEPAAEAGTAIFQPNDRVLFDDTADLKSVTLIGTNRPGRIAFANSALYTVAGGGIAGSASVTKTGTGTARFSNSAVDHAGGTVAAGGVLSYQYVGTRAFGTQPIRLEGGVFEVYGNAGHETATLSNDIVVGASGGKLQVWDAGNSLAGYFSGRILGAGRLVLQTQTGVGDGARMFLTGDNAGFTGTLVVQGSLDPLRSVSFYGQSTVPGGTTRPINVNGGSIYFRTAEAYLNNVNLTGDAALFVDAVIVTLAGGVAGNSRNLTFGGHAAGATVLAPVDGRHVGGVSNLTVSGAAVAPASLQILPDANLNLSGGVLVLDDTPGSGIAWTDFLANRTNGYGAGAMQWRLAAGGGFAARNSDVALAGFNPNRDWTMGSGARSGPALFADRTVLVPETATLPATGTRTWSARGRNDDVRYDARWTVNAVPQVDVTGLITGGGTGAILRLQAILADDVNYGGTVRISNPANDFTGRVEVGFHPTAGMGSSSLVAIFAGDSTRSALGKATAIVVGPGGNRDNGGAMLLFEDVDPYGPARFSKNFTLMNRPVFYTRGERNAWGSWAGDVVYSGRIASVNGLGHAVYVLSGTLALDGATQDFRTANDGDQLMMKWGAGELILRSLTVMPRGAYAWRWELREGTLTTTSDSMALLRSAPSLDWNNLFNTGNNNVRRWRVTSQDQTYSANAGTFQNNTFVDVTDGIRLTTTQDAAELVPAAVNDRLCKTGGGVWTYRNTDTALTTGNAGFVRVEQGTLDVAGNMGSAAFEIDGGTLLSGNLSSLTGRGLYVRARGGKIGISSVATSHVVRTVAVSGWDVSVTGVVTLASRDDLNLVFGAGIGASIGAATTLQIDRDGNGSSAVQINSPALAVDGRLAGNGMMRLMPDASGTLTVNGAIAPAGRGATGTLTVAGNVIMPASATIEYDLGSAGADSLVVNGQLTLNGELVVNNLAPPARGTYRIASYAGGLVDNGLTTRPVNGDWSARIDSSRPGEIRYVLDDLPAAPIVQNLLAANVGGTTADLRCELMSTGAASTVLFVYWGTTDAGTNAAAWPNSRSIGRCGVGVLAYSASGLSRGTTYRYRFLATNAFGRSWADTSEPFTTVATPMVDNGGGASGGAFGSATLNGRLFNDAADAVIFWGPSDGGASRAAWPHAIAIGRVSAGASFAGTARGLLYGVPYYYRCYATNAAGESWAPTPSAFQSQPPTVAPPGLLVTTYNDRWGASNLDPISNLVNAAASGSMTQTAPINHTAFAGTFPGITVDDTFSILWRGVFVAGQNTNYTFGTESDDGSVIYLDLNRDGDFADAGERVLNNNGDHPVAIVTAGTRLDAGQYPFAIGYYDNTGFNTMRARWGIGAGLTWTQLTPIDGTGGAFRQGYVLPAVAVSNLWATNVTVDAAELQAVVNATGAVLQVSIYWGETDGRTNATAWAHASDIGSYTNVAGARLNYPVSGLAPARSYFYTFRGRNAALDRWSAPAVSFRTAGPGGGDSDGDGIPDDWETANGLNPAVPNTGDTDGDGATDRQEFVANTSPKNPASVLRLERFTFSRDTLTLYFDSSSERQYAIQWRPLMAGTSVWRSVTNRIDGTGREVGVAVRPAIPASFYRLGVDLRPTP